MLTPHLGTATQLEQRRGEDCETLLHRLVDRGLLERVTAALAATGHATLESLQAYLAQVG